MEAFAGVYKNEVEWAEEYLEGTGMFDNVNETIRQYFDFEAYARDMECGAMSFVEYNHQVYVFYNLTKRLVKRDA